MMTRCLEKWCECRDSPFPGAYNQGSGQAWLVVRGCSAVADDKEAEKKKGPKGGAKHTPGRGHDTSSNPSKKKRFRMKAAKRQREKQELARKLWQEWDEMSTDLRKLLGPNGEPKLPRPKNEN
jgi:hypothetical protein